MELGSHIRLKCRQGFHILWKVAAGAHLISLALLLFLARAGWPAMLSMAVTVLFFGATYLPWIPISKRFFPISTLAGVAGVVTPLFV